MNLSNSETIIRPWRSADLQYILPLFAQEYGVSYPIDEWQWRYQVHNGTGTGNNWMAEVNGEIAGCNGSLPIPLLVGNRELIVAQSCDTMVKRSFRRKGIFGSIIHRIFFAEDEETPAYCGIGFPVPQSYEAFLKVGAYGIGALYKWILVLNPEKLIKTFHLPIITHPFANGLRSFSKGFLKVCSIGVKRIDIEICKDKATLFSQIWKDMRDPKFIVINKTTDYITWRYTTAPRPYTFLTFKTHGDVLGIVATRQVRVKGFVVQELADIAVTEPNPANFRRVLAAFSLWALERRAEIVRIIMHNYIPRISLLSLGYIPLKNPTPLIVFDHFLPSDIMKNLFFDFRRWKLIGGDWDVI